MGYALAIQQYSRIGTLAFLSEGTGGQRVFLVVVSGEVLQ